MPLSPLLLSIDSFIVAVALSTAVGRRHVLPLIVLFALCDGFGSAVAPALGIRLPLTGLLSPILLTSWGALMMLGFPLLERWRGSPALGYLLPPLLALDNMLVPDSHPAIVAGLCSGVMAAFGFACGFMILRRVLALPKSPRFVGASLLAGGCLLAIGA